MTTKAVGSPQLHPRFKNEELKKIKEVFADNDELIKLCYRVFYQLPLDEQQEDVIDKTFKGSDLENIFDKLFRPSEDNEQIYYGVDNWFDLQLAEKSLDAAELAIAARMVANTYIEEQLERLFGKDLPEYHVKFSDLKEMKMEVKDTQINLLARQEIINKVRNLFGFIQAWAGRKDEGVEDTAKRLYKDSAK